MVCRVCACGWIWEQRTLYEASCSSRYVHSVCTLCAPHRSTGQRPLSPGGYHVMNSPSEEEMHSIRENLKVMRTQSLKFHRLVLLCAVEG